MQNLFLQPAWQWGMSGGGTCVEGGSCVATGVCVAGGLVGMGVYMAGGCAWWGGGRGGDVRGRKNGNCSGRTYPTGMHLCFSLKVC